MIPIRSLLNHRPTRRAGAFGEAGFSTVELVLTLLILGVLYGTAQPSIIRMRTAASVTSGRHVVASTLSLARATAIGFGRSTVVRLDAAGDRIWVEADTSAAGGGAVDTLGLFYFGSALSVDLKSNRASLCFDNRGLGTTNATCTVAGALIVVARQGLSDPVTVSSLGRVLPR